jgi:hypothetical protein
LPFVTKLQPIVTDGVPVVTASIGSEHAGYFCQQLPITQTKTKPMTKRKKLLLNIAQHFHSQKYKLSLFVVFMLTTCLHAQMQYNQWAFGRNASYDFTPPGGPLVIPPTINSLHDAAVWCNPTTGNMMFYTDGQSIFNNVGPDCLNCLNGNPNNGSAVQGVLIVPNVSAGPDEFYIFTVSDHDYAAPLSPDTNNGLTCYRFNATVGIPFLVAQMGVTPGTFGSFTTEALTAVRHANGVDFWVIVKPIIVPAGSPTFIGAFNPTPTAPAGATNSSLYAYLVSASGVSSTPVISNANAPADFGPGPLNVTNEIKCSPDGQYATWTNRTAANAGNTNLYRFNSGTGQFLFLQTLPMAVNAAPYGASFSPNSRVLYVGGHRPFGPAATGAVLRQYDLNGIDCNPYVAPSFCDYFSPAPFATRPTQMQLTPDGRIFRVRHNSQTVDVINSPDVVGCAGMNYQSNAITVATAPDRCHHAFPNNIDAFTAPSGLAVAWPQSSTNTVTVDNGVALDVDQSGNVYSTGTFKQSTQFGPYTITGGGTTSSYLVKYTSCGEVDWVAKGIPTTPFGFVICHSTDTWDAQQRVFVTGRFRGNATFTSGVGTLLPCPMPGGINITGSGIFIAVYNYSGCLLGVHTIQDDANYIHNSAHITTGTVFNPTTGFNENRVYVAVNETPTTTSDRIRVYAFSLVGPATLNSAWIVPLRCMPGSEVIDISMFGTRIAITGTYNGPIHWNTEIPPFASTTVPAAEAFVATMLDVNGFAVPTKVVSQTCGLDPGTDEPRSTAAGVSVVGASVFLTGTYTGITSNVFGTGIPLAGNGATSCAYAVRLNTGGGSWAHTFSCDGVVFGHDVVARNGAGAAVYFTGTWVDDTVFNIDNTAMPAIVPKKKHIYVVKIMLNGNYLAPTAWQNHSYMSSDITDFMKPARVALSTNNQWLYVNGSYMGTAQMNNDFAPNAPLTSTPGTFNSFVWRFRAPVNGTSLRESQDETDDETVTEESPLQLKLFPNPAQTTLTIQRNAPSENANIEIYNSSGQLMTSFTTTATNTTVDVSDWALGIYFVRIASGGEVVTEKFIRN